MIDKKSMRKAARVVHKEKNRLPLSATKETISLCPDAKALPHFHHSMELIHLTEGHLDFHINQEQLLLSPGDCLIINMGQSHYCRPAGNEKCTYHCILFSPEILTGSSYLKRKFISPIIRDPRFTYLQLQEKTVFARHAGLLIDKIVELSYSKNPARELEQIGELHIFFSDLYSFYKSGSRQFIHSEYVENPALRNMLAFMEHHYADKLSLDDIAEAGHVSRSKCCRIFKECARQTPMTTLNFYRLEISKNLLKNTKETVS